MSDPRDPLDDLVSSVADDTVADWSAARDRAEPEVESLRGISEIATFHRQLQRAAPELPGGAPVEWNGLVLLERIGAGARAEVWKAWDPALRRDVALKLLRGDAATLDHDRAAILDEARAASRVSHPHVITIHGVAEHDGRVGLWMERLPGTTLEERVRTRGPLADLEVARLGAELASALAAVHAAGVLHRDLKPANVLLHESRGAVLSDFGLGVGRDVRASVSHPGSGTPMYMAPEIFRGEAPGPTADVYGLGLTLWFALAGEDPFPSGTLAERQAAGGRGPDPALRSRRPRGDPKLDAIVARAIAVDPAARFPSAADLERALAAWRPRSSRRGLAVALGVAALLFLLAGITFLPARLVFPPARRPAAESVAGDVPLPGSARPAAGAYSVGATFFRHDADGRRAVANGDLIRPGDQLSLSFHASRPLWVYVLDEDERGERYLLFPQPAYAVKNPVPPDRDVNLPGSVGREENAWTVTSRGGREHFLVVASPEPVAELERQLASLPAPTPDHAIDPATVPDAALEPLRGVGGYGATRTPARAAPGSAFDSFRALAGRENAVTGVWARQIVLENPLR